MGPPFDLHPTSAAEIREFATPMAQSADNIDGVLDAMSGPAQQAADAADGVIDGVIQSPVGTAKETGMATAAGARLCKSAVELFADCVELFDKGVTDINRRWAHAKENHFFVPDDKVDDKEAVAAARSEEAAALRLEYQKLEQLLDTDAQGVASALTAGPAGDGPALVKAHQAEVDMSMRQLTKPEYVAVGDSYSAGTGAGPYYTSGPNNPFRSHSAYPWLVAAHRGFRLDHRAVNGATTDGQGGSPSIADQLTTLGPDTKYVTLTAGGNNIGFSTAVESSVLGDGTADIAESKRRINEELPQDLDALYDEIAKRAPNATVVVGTYPKLFDGADYPSNPRTADIPDEPFRPDSTLVNGEEEQQMNEAQADLEAVIRDRAAAHGFKVADIGDRFEGHESDAVGFDDWVNGLSIGPYGTVESFHPNVEGHQQYAEEFEEQLR